MQRSFALLSVLALGLFTFLCSGFATADAQAQSAAFSNTNLCAPGQSTPAPCSQTQLIAVNVAAPATIGTVRVVTGGQPNLDFTQASGGTCMVNADSGSICTVNVTFAPRQAGGRLGAVQLLDDGGNVLATTFLRGIGVGPQAAFGAGGVMPVGSGLQNPNALAVDSAGDVFIASHGFPGSPIVEVPADGSPQITVVSDSHQAQAMAVDGAGDLFWVTSNGNAMEQPVGSSTLFQISIPGPFAVSIAVDGSGNLFISSPFSIAEFPAAGGGPITVPGTYIAPYAIAADAEGNLFVSDENLQNITEVPGGTGTPITLASGQFVFSMSVDGEGNLYAASSNVTVFPAGGGQPYSIDFQNAYHVVADIGAVDAGGNLYAFENVASSAFKLVRAGGPPSLSFATTNVGSTSSDSPQVVQVLNNGNQPLAFASLAASTDFSLLSANGALPDCSVSTALAAGAICNLGISFTPGEGGSLTGAVTLVDNSANVDAATQSIGLSGTALVIQTTSTSLAANTASTIYSAQVTLTATVSAAAGPPVGTVTFLAGSTPLGTASLDGSGVATFTTSTIPVGVNSITASFAANLNFLASASDPVTVSVAPAIASVSTADVCPAGRTSPAPCSQTVTVTYKAGIASTLGTPNVVTLGSPNLDFNLASTTCGSTINAGDTCTVTVNFTPRFPGLRQGGVQMVDGSGNVLATYLIQGTAVAPQIAFDAGSPALLAGGDFSLCGPQQIALDGAGDLFIADMCGLFEVPVSTGVATIMNASVGQPAGIAVDGAGNIFVSDQSNGNVIELPAGGGAQFVVASGFGSPGTLALDGSGNLYVADFGASFGQGKIVRVALESALQTTLVNNISVLGLVVDAAGNVYGTDYGNRIVFEVPTGCTNNTCMVTLNVGRPGAASFSLALDAAGDLYIADQTSLIKEYPVGGGTPLSIANFAEGFESLRAIALDAAGNLYVGNAADSNYFGAATVTVTPRTQPPSLSFTTTDTGLQSVDSPQSTTVRNIGNTRLTIQSLSIGSSFLKIAGSGTPIDCGGDVPLLPGAVCNLSIGFKPKTGGPITGSAILTDNTLYASGTPHTIALSGTGFVKLPQTITFATIPAQTIGAMPSLSATASSGLAVVLASTTPSTCSVSGTTASVTAAGTCTIQATQPGNSTYLAAPPMTRSFAVKLLPQTISFASIGAQTIGAPVALSATATSGLTVAFTSTTLATCSVQDASATLLSAGTCIIQATQTGGGNYTAAPPVIRSFSVKRESQTITVAAIPTQMIGIPVPLVAAASSNLTVSFTSSTLAICSVSGVTAMPLATGTCSIQATQPGDGTYAAAAPVIRNFSIKLQTQTVDFPTIPAQTVGVPLSLNATASSSLAVTYSSLTPSVCTVSNSTATLLRKGTCRLSATQSGNSTYAAASATQSFIVN